MEIERTITEARLQPTYKEWKQGFNFFPTVEDIGLQPTYKEWKLAAGYVRPPLSLRLQPTYKEWKLSASPLANSQGARLQPTYKEWKLGPNTAQRPEKRPVYSLPIRNGNFYNRLQRVRRHMFTAYL